MTINEIMEKYTAGEYTPEEANAALDNIKGNNVHIDPNRNALYAHEVINKTAGLMDTGTGTLDKVTLDGNKITSANMGNSYALVWVGGKMYHVDGDTLVE